MGISADLLCLTILFGHILIISTLWMFHLIFFFFSSEVLFSFLYCKQYTGIISTIMAIPFSCMHNIFNQLSTCRSQLRCYRHFSALCLNHHYFRKCYVAIYTSLIEVSHLFSVLPTTPIPQKKSLMLMLKSWMGR